jgi:hypothetical protein
MAPYTFTETDISGLGMFRHIGVSGNFTYLLLPSCGSRWDEYIVIEYSFSVKIRHIKLSLLPEILVYVRLMGWKEKCSCSKQYSNSRPSIWQVDNQLSYANRWIKCLKGKASTFSQKHQCFYFLMSMVEKYGWCHFVRLLQEYKSEHFNQNRLSHFWKILILRSFWGFGG